MKRNLNSDQFSYPGVFYFQYENCVDFLWRLARAYGDLFEMTTDANEKRKYVADGKQKKNIYLECHLNVVKDV